MRSMRAADEKCALLACMYKRYSHLLFPISNGMLSVESRAFLIYFSLLKCHVIKLSGTQTKLFQIKTKPKTFQLTHTNPLRVTLTSQTSIVMMLNIEFLASTVSCIRSGTLLSAESSRGLPWHSYCSRCKGGRGEGGNGCCGQGSIIYLLKLI